MVFILLLLQISTSSYHLMQGNVVQEKIILSFYVKYVPTPLGHIELAQYSDYIAVEAISKLITPLVKYLVTYLGQLYVWHLDYCCRFSI